LIRVVSADEPPSMATNRIITIAIITVLVLLIVAVIYSKFR
jgi:vesicle transport through interaction with t-SNAREs protein 1